MAQTKKHQIQTKKSQPFDSDGDLVYRDVCLIKSV